MIEVVLGSIQKARESLRDLRVPRRVSDYTFGRVLLRDLLCGSQRVVAVNHHRGGDAFALDHFDGAFGRSQNRLRDLVVEVLDLVHVVRDDAEGCGAAIEDLWRVAHITGELFVALSDGTRAFDIHASLQTTRRVGVKVSWVSGGK